MPLSYSKGGRDWGYSVLFLPSFATELFIMSVRYVAKWLFLYVVYLSAILAGESLFVFSLSSLRFISALNVA